MANLEFTFHLGACVIFASVVLYSVKVAQGHSFCNRALSPVYEQSQTVRRSPSNLTSRNMQLYTSLCVRNSFFQRSLGRAIGRPSPHSSIAHESFPFNRTRWQPTLGVSYCRSKCARYSEALWKWIRRLLLNHEK